MRLEQLEILIYAAETHSMQKAADSLHTTIQNVSKTIKQLENELNVTLFHRTKHGVFLSADGEFVYKEAKNVQKSIESIKQKYYFHTIPPQNSLSGSLTILTCSAMSKDVSGISRYLRERYSALNIANIVENPLTINDHLFNAANKNDSYDVIITSFNSKSINKLKSLANEYSIYFLREDRIGVHINSTHPYAKLKSIPLKSLLNTPLITLSTSRNNHSHLLSIIEEETGIALKPNMWTNSTKECTEFILNGLGYGIMAFSENHPQSELTIIPLKEKIYISYLLILPNYAEIPPQTQLFKDMIYDKFKETFTRLF